MLKDIFHYIYCMSIPSTMIVLLIVCSLWRYIASKCDGIAKKKIWKSVNIVLFLIWIFCVVYMTVFSRGGKSEINLIPFRFIFEPFRTGNEEFFRTGWMNILLFVPGGMWSSYGIKKQTKAKCILQVVFLMLASILIETLQWYYKLGTVETDDVICNTLGAIIGVTSIVWAGKMGSIIKPYCFKLLNFIKQIIKNLMS